MNHLRLLCSIALSFALATLPAPGEGKAYTEPAQTDEDFPFQGEYVGTVDTKPFGMQVVALGAGKFEAVPCPGGLPGEGWDTTINPRPRIAGERKDGSVTFTGPEWVAKTDGKTFVVSTLEGKESGNLEKIERKSTTLDAKPPEGAVVLFNGKAEGWGGGRVTEDGFLMEGATSEKMFRDFSIHIEFRLPYQPEARGQGRGNSGIYLQGRYEVQMLDSFGLNGEDNECGGIYKVGRPKVNMCFPPLAWQTYDIDFTAARWEDGKKTANASITVRHNNVVIHENLEIPNPTTAAPLTEKDEPGPVFLQNHGNPVRYRNVWVVEKP